MGIGVEGAFSTLMRPDMGLILSAMAGKEEAVTENSNGNYIHTFHAIGTALPDSLPSVTAKVNRVAGQFAYTGLKINSVAFNAAAGDYLKIDVTFNGKDEETTTMTSNLTPSARKAFRFAGGKVSIAGSEVADITSIAMTYSNNLDAQTQTTSTGNYYAEPECGVREIATDLEMIYSASAETIRALYYKTDNTFSLTLEFESDEVIGSTTDKYKLKIEIPANQVSDSSANMGGLERLNQNISCNAVDLLSGEFVTFTLLNEEESQY